MTVWRGLLSIRLSPALCLLVHAASAQATPHLELVDVSLTPAEATATRQLLTAAVERLPAAWADALDHSIAVEWRDDLPEEIHGRATTRRMLLNRKLLEDWMEGPRGDAEGENPAPRAALTAVIHELAHFYDRTSQGGLSRDARLLDLAGWQVRPKLGGRKSHNEFSDRTPDRYELSSPVEFVAVNLELFLLDPDYACRRPALYDYFSARLGTLRPQVECPRDLLYLQAGTEENLPPVLPIDPTHVYAVEYLLAEGNEQPLSRWGHSMLRLVICAPERTPGPDCRFDLQYHRVLSFRAFVNDVQLSSWRGLMGSYPSRLYVLPLDQVIEEYTKIELRGLQSIPLKLEPAEIAKLIERAASLHWSYDGRYYFLSNNCAVETFKLLHDGVPRLAGEDLASTTPTGLLRRLVRAGIADTTVLENRDEALLLGYRFDALSDRFQAMLDVARRSLPLSPARVVDWLDMNPADRAPWLSRGNLQASAALLLLEQAALRRQQVLARDEIKRRFLGRAASRTAEHAETLHVLQELLQLEGFLSRPAMLLADTGYGLPQPEEREWVNAESGRRAAQWREQSRWLHAEALEWLSPERQAALAGTEANIDLLGEQLRRLHREQGGIQLQQASSDNP